MTMGDYNNNNNEKAQFGDTILTKVFVGGLAWETPKQALYDHFVKYGEILEAVIISDKITGKSKGYGFVTFKEQEAAKKACEDATPTINGRRTNCNLAALGARRPPRSSSTTPQPHQRPAFSNSVGGGGGDALSPTQAAAPAGQVQWYYQTAITSGRAGSPTATAPFHAYQHHQAVPFYGYSPTYITADVGYNQKLSYNGGAYINASQYAQTQMYAGQAMMARANTFMPVYPYYSYPHHYQQLQHQAAMGFSAHVFPPTSTGLPIITKPTSPVCIAPPSGLIGARGSLKKDQ